MQERDPSFHENELEVAGALAPGYEAILSPEALAFLAELTRNHRPRVAELLARRRERQARIDDGQRPGFLADTREIRESDWRAAPIPQDLLDRRVEITGPTDRKTVINALNSGANCFMADFEDATSPTWRNLIEGQINLRDAVAGTIRFEDPRRDRTYALEPRTATLFVRPRGWHLPERHLLVDGEPVPAALFDFALFFFHNAKPLLANGSGPYFYLPKLESHLEAGLWNDVFLDAQRLVGIPAGSIRATVLIETLPAVFEMDEILYALREHSAGLNCGRWDYIFSFIKTFRADGERLLPDRQQVTMLQPFMRAYTQLLVKTCHRRGIHAMGGMAPQIPVRDDEALNRGILDKVRADKLREAGDGHDGTWVAHPGLIRTAREVFDQHMRGPNQIDVRRGDFSTTAGELIRPPEGTRTLRGLRENTRVGTRYIAAWLGGTGAVPLYHLMEDAATAEICRVQIWQWLHHGATMDDGHPLTEAKFLSILDEETGNLAEDGDAGAHFGRAVDLFRELCLAEQCAAFLTLPAYEQLLELEQAAD